MSCDSKELINNLFRSSRGRQVALQVCSHKDLPRRNSNKVNLKTQSRVNLRILSEKSGQDPDRLTTTLSYLGTWVSVLYKNPWKFKVGKFFYFLCLNSFTFFLFSHFKFFFFELIWDFLKKAFFVQKQSKLSHMSCDISFT